MRQKKQYTVQLEDDVVERIDKLAQKAGITRSQAMRNYIMMGLDDAELVNKTGMYDAVIFSKKLFSKVKEAVLKGKIMLDEKEDLKFVK